MYFFKNFLKSAISKLIYRLFIIRHGVFTTKKNQNSSKMLSRAIENLLTNSTNYETATVIAQLLLGFYISLLVLIETNLNI